MAFCHCGTRIMDCGIENFSKFLDTASPSSSVTTDFQPLKLGESLWRVGLNFKTENEIVFNLDLELSPARYPPESGVFVRFDWSVLDMKEFELITPDEPIQLRKYTANNGDWKEEYPFMTWDKLRTAGILDDNDTLRIWIWIRIEVYEGFEEPKESSSSSQEILQRTALDDVGIDVGDLLKTGKGSDCVIRVKGLDSGEWFEKRVHKLVLSARSPVFDIMFESPMSENETGIVTIEDLSPKGLDVLLEYIYTGSVSNEWKLVPEQVLNAAEKYELPLLKDFVGEWLHTAVTPENAVILFNLAKQHSQPQAYENISVYIKENLEKVLCRI